MTETANCYTNYSSVDSDEGNSTAVYFRRISGDLTLRIDESGTADRIRRSLIRSVWALRNFVATRTRLINRKEPGSARAW